MPRCGGATPPGAGGVEKGQRARATGGLGGRRLRAQSGGGGGWAARGRDPREVGAGALPGAAKARAHQGVRLSQEGKGPPCPLPPHRPEQTWALAEAKGGG